MKTKKLWILPAIALLAGSAVAQDDARPPKQDTGRYFRLDFVVKEVNEGKATNSRTYSTIVTTKHSENDSIRTGSKVPVANGTNGYTYMDVGVSIDCRSVEEAPGKLMLNVSADISSQADTAAAPLPPVVRNNRWSSNVVVPIGKSTVIFSSDDVSSKGKIELELTATPIA
jgi:hypothetical protein